MLWELDFGEITITIQQVLNALKDLLKKIFDGIADSEGWVEEDTAA